MNFFFALFFITTSSYAYDSGSSDLCKYFVHCGGTARSSGGSLPSSGAASNFNPSTISKMHGLGLETTYQPENPLNFALLTGNGKIGALIYPNLDNSFFGNRTFEVDEVYFERFIDKKQYKNKKLNLAVGLNLADKKNFGLDIGVSAKRNPDVRKINPGIGATLRLFHISAGAYIYKDDTKVELGNYLSPYTGIPYSVTFNNSSYAESYWIKTYTAELQLMNLTLDAGFINTKYKFYPMETNIAIYSASYSWKKFLFIYALRKESSSNLDIVGNALVSNQDKHRSYLGLQYSLAKNFVAGLQYNHFLLNEWSVTGTIFFF